MQTPERPTNGVIPFLTIRDGRATEALAFYAAAFGAVEKERNLTPDGSKLMHASMVLNGGWLMMADDFPEFRGAPSSPPASVMMHLVVPDADAVYERALGAGAAVEMAISDQFWGDRYGQVRDPFGHVWGISTPLNPR